MLLSGISKPQKMILASLGWIILHGAGFVQLEMWGLCVILGSSRVKLGLKAVRKGVGETE